LKNVLEFGHRHLMSQMTSTFKEIPKCLVKSLVKWVIISYENEMIETRDNCNELQLTVTKYCIWCTSSV